MHITGQAPCSRACLRESSQESKPRKNVERGSQQGKQVEGESWGGGGPWALQKPCLQPVAAAQGSPGSCPNPCQTPWRNARHGHFQFCHLQSHHLPPPGKCASIAHVCMHAPCVHTLHSSLLQVSGSPTMFKSKKNIFQGRPGSCSSLLSGNSMCVARILLSQS